MSSGKLISKNYGEKDWRGPGTLLMLWLRFAFILIRNVAVSPPKCPQNLPVKVYFTLTSYWKIKILHRSKKRKSSKSVKIKRSFSICNTWIYTNIQIYIAYIWTTHFSKKYEEKSSAG